MTFGLFCVYWGDNFLFARLTRSNNGHRWISIESPLFVIAFCYENGILCLMIRYRLSPQCSFTITNQCQYSWLYSLYCALSFHLWFIVILFLPSCDGSYMIYLIIYDFMSITVGPGAKVRLKPHFRGSSSKSTKPELKLSLQLRILTYTQSHYINPLTTLTMPSLSSYYLLRLSVPKTI